MEETNSENVILRLIFAVMTNGDIWKITARESLKCNELPHYAQVKKIAEKGKSIKNGRILKKGTFVAIQPKKLALFYAPIGFYEKSLLEMPDEKSEDWGCEASGQIVALFLKRKEAIECFKQSDLMMNDFRWENQTEEVVRLIGLDHPFFCISPNILESFSNCHDLGMTPKERKVLQKQRIIKEQVSEKTQDEDDDPEGDKKTPSGLDTVDLPAAFRAIQRLKGIAGLTPVTTTAKKAEVVPNEETLPTPVETSLPEPKTEEGQVQIAVPDDTKPKDIGGGKTFVLLVERQIKLHRIFPEINNGDSLFFKPGKYELKMVQIVGNVKHYAIETTHGIMYGRSAPDLEMFCEVERTEASVVLTYK